MITVKKSKQSLLLMALLFVKTLVISQSISKIQDAVVQLPDELIGSWLLADGSRQFHYGFYTKKAVFSRKIWGYKSVDVNGKRIKITLQNNNEEKHIYAELKRNKKAYIGDTPNNLKTYSLKPKANSRYKEKNDMHYKGTLFKKGMAMYSGVIVGYETQEKTNEGIIVLVNNIITGVEETYKAEITPNGYFSTVFPVTHPQQVKIKLPHYQMHVFVIPDKETFHVVHDKASYFMGDCAQINSDLNLVDLDDVLQMHNVIERIGTMSPKAYKKLCFDKRDAAKQQLKAIKNKYAICAKAFQIKTLDIDYKTLCNILEYQRYRFTLVRENKKIKNGESKKPYKKVRVKKGYYNFINETHLKKEVAVLSKNYYDFIDRLGHKKRLFRKKGARLDLPEIGNALQEIGYTLTDQEVYLLEAYRKIGRLNERLPLSIVEAQAQIINEHRENYLKYYGETLGDFIKNKSISASVARYLKARDSISLEEQNFIKSLNYRHEGEATTAVNVFKQICGAFEKEFYKRYKNEIPKIKASRERDAGIDGFKAHYGVSEGLVFDLMISQSVSEYMLAFYVYSKARLEVVRQKIKTPFVFKYLEILNERGK
jgi:hypothetical protein